MKVAIYGQYYLVSTEPIIKDIFVFLLFFIAFYCLELVLYELCIYFVQILLFQGKISKKYRMQLGASTVSGFLFSSLMC